MILLKTCTKCGKAYPKTNEYWQVNKRANDGLQWWCRSCTRQYYRSNKAHYDEYHAEYRKVNHDKRASRWPVDQANRKARIKQLPSEFSRSDWARALNYFNGCCAVCGRQLRDLWNTHTPSIDHWIPVNKGGGTVPTNIVPLCHGLGGCNESKCDRLPDEWVRGRYSKNKAKKIINRINAYFDWIKSQDNAA